MKKVVLIDIDDTVFDFIKCSFYAFSSSLNELNISFKKSYYEYFRYVDSKLWKLQKEGILNVEKVLYKRAELITKHLNLEVSPEVFLKIFSNNLAYASIEIKDARSLLSYLSEKYILCAASNGIFSMQKNRLVISNLDKYFSKIYVSNIIGYEKPDYRFFAYILNDLHFNKDDIIMIGDSLDSDIKGAYNFGIDSIYFNKNNIDLKDRIFNYKVDCLKEIMNIL